MGEAPLWFYPYSYPITLIKRINCNKLEIGDSLINICQIIDEYSGAMGTEVSILGSVFLIPSR